MTGSSWDEDEFCTWCAKAALNVAAFVPEGRMAGVFGNCSGKKHEPLGVAKAGSANEIEGRPQ